jgi:hypothetical protein
VRIFGDRVVVSSNTVASSVLKCPEMRSQNYVSY